MKNLKHFLFTVFLAVAGSIVFAQETEIYIHKTTDSNINSHITTIDHVSLDENSNRYPVITHNFNPGGGAGKYQTGKMGLFYSAKKWKIFDNELKALVDDTYYNVLLPSIGTMSWAHTTTAENIVNNYTIIDHAAINGKPDLQLFVCHMYNPGGGSGTYFKHNVGVFYVTTIKKWAIYNQDQVDMPENISFNIVVPKNVPETMKSFVHTADFNNLSNYITVLDHELLNNNPDAKIIVSMIYNPGGSIFGKYNDHPIGVYYNGTKWAIYNEDKQTMTDGASFNVLIVSEEQQTNSNNQIMEIPSLRIGPNPVGQGKEITVGLYNDHNEVLTIEIVDLQGKVLITREIIGKAVVVEHFSTEELSQGMYFLRVSSQRLNAVRRLIIQ